MTWYTEPRSPGWQASPEDWSAYLARVLAWAFDDGDERPVHYAGPSMDLVGRHRVAHSTVRNWSARHWVEPGERGKYRVKCLVLTDDGRAAIAASEDE